MQNNPEYLIQYYRDDDTGDILSRTISANVTTASLLFELAGHPSCSTVVGFDIAGEQCYMRKDGKAMSDIQRLATRNGEYDTI